MHRAVISLFFRTDVKRLRREWDGSGVGAGSAAAGTLCPAVPLMKYICFIFPSEKGKREHAAFSPWSGSTTTTEVSPPVLSACLILTGFGLGCHWFVQHSPSGQVSSALLHGSYFLAVILYEKAICGVTRPVRIDKFFPFHEKNCMCLKQWRNLSIGRCVEAEACITTSWGRGPRASVKFTSRLNYNK